MFPTAISSPAVIPVSRSPSPVSASDMRMTATSGRTSCKLLHKNDPLGAVSRTFMVTSAWASTKCFLTWKAKGTPAGRLLFQLAVSMRPTSVLEPSLLHTPTATANQMAPSMVAKGSGWMWATPAAADSVGTTGGGQGKSLRTDVKMWPTPTAQDAKNNGGPSQHKRNTKPLNAEVGGSLNPQFVEWLMGYPAGWTSLEIPQEQSKASKDEPTD